MVARSTRRVDRAAVPAGEQEGAAPELPAVVATRDPSSRTTPTAKAAIRDRAAARDRVRTLVQALKPFDLSNVYIRPALRELLEKP